MLGPCAGRDPSHDAQDALRFYPDEWPYGTLYTGSTVERARRMSEHKLKLTPGWKINLIERDNPRWLDLYPSLPL